MRFAFDNNRSTAQQRVFDSAMVSTWRVSDVFSAGSISEVGDERSRLEWAPVLASQAFGEATAFAGFGQRIAESDDISTKTWLTVHLLDESKHTEGFSALLDHLYPSYRGRQEALLRSKDVLVFYGRTQRSDDLLQWLICTQIAEIFGMNCYKALHQKLSQDPIAGQFFANIISDEGRHIAYIGSLVDERRKAISEKAWNTLYAPFAESMILYARNMFEARKCGANFHSFVNMGIDVTAFCDAASAELARKLLRSQGCE
ncbi:MAG: ferritin-like domain-containing protein [Proteobacteria bacterium]|nr:ferritin-like domain-containing protein [Pseudomonadota bacterium]